MAAAVHRLLWIVTLIVAAAGQAGGMEHIWSRNFGDAWPQTVTALAISPGGDIVFDNHWWNTWYEYHRCNRLRCEGYLWFYNDRNRGCLCKADY